MNIQFHAKNLDLTGEIKDYIQEKIGNLDKYEINIIDCQTELSRDTHHQKGKVYTFEANLKIATTQKTLRAVAESENIMSAIDLVKDKLQRQITKIKEKNNR